MNKEEIFKVYPPGSDAAIEAGCTCPIIDNSRGKGAFGGSIMTESGEIIYWINSNCKLHAQKD